MEGETLMEEVANEALATKSLSEMIENQDIKLSPTNHLETSHVKEESQEETTVKFAATTSLGLTGEDNSSKSYSQLEHSDEQVAADAVEEPKQSTSCNKPPAGEDLFRSPPAKRQRTVRPSPMKSESVSVSVNSMDQSGSECDQQPIVMTESEPPMTPPSMADESTTIGGVPSLFGEDEEEEEEEDYQLEEDENGLASPSKSGKDQDKEGVAKLPLEDDEIATLRKADEDRRLMALVSHFTEDQWNRYECYKRTSFQRSAVKRMMQSVARCTVTQDVAIAMAGIAKVFVGEVIEEAVAFRDRIGESGALHPKHLQEAMRILNQRVVSSKRQNRNTFSSLL